MLAARAGEGFPHPTDLSLDGVFHAEPDEQERPRSQQMAQRHKRCFVVRLDLAAGGIQRAVAIGRQNHLLGPVDETMQMPDRRLPDTIPVDVHEVDAVARGPVTQVWRLRTRPPQHLVVVCGDYQRAAQPPDGSGGVEARPPHALGRRIELGFEKVEPERPHRVASHCRRVQVLVVLHGCPNPIRFGGHALRAQPFRRSQQKAAPGGKQMISRLIRNRPRDTGPGERNHGAGFQRVD